VSWPRGWHLEGRSATARALHEPWPPAELVEQRVLCRCEVTGPATLVVGSGQRDDEVDSTAATRAGVDVVRRGSGGGAVLVVPGAQLWLDAWIPRRDALWEEDVVRAAWWLGDAWAAALQRFGAPSPRVHRGRAVRGEWSDRVCFAGIGPGEVAVDGRKVVGLSQRRTRAGARMSSLALWQWDPVPLLGLLTLDDEARRRAAVDVGPQAAGLRSVIVGTVPEEPATIFDAVAAEVATRLP
jgi:lipoate-protein ligase A